MYCNAKLVLTMVLVGLLVPAGWAADKSERKELTDKPVPGNSAAGIDFKKAYSLPFDCLHSVGTRIERARSVPDPVAIASISAELAACEQASGKMAALTSANLFKEAVDLAKLRSESVELKAVALLVKDAGLAKELEQLAAQAKEQEEEDAKAAKAGERGKGIMATLTVQNGSNDWIQVFVNGFSIGVVRPFGDNRFFVGHPRGINTQLFARASDGKTYGPAVVFNDIPSYTWNLIER